MWTLPISILDRDHDSRDPVEPLPGVDHGRQVPRPDGAPLV